MLRPIEEMHRQDDLWVCTYDMGERVRTRLDRLNARERPFTIKPLPYPKPQNPYYPNTLETDDAAVFNFLDRMVTARSGLESVAAGAAPVGFVLGTDAQGNFADEGGVIAGLSWAGRYLYDLIRANDRASTMLTRAKDLLRSLADYLLTTQYGSPTSSFPAFTRAANAYYGAVSLITSPGSNFPIQTEDCIVSGLALLYAYRILGDVKYIVGARASANFLRNVQALGQCGTTFPSKDPGGTQRLVTGSLSSEISSSDFASPSTIAPIAFLFYPSALLALEFWNELKTTDGDQSIGAPSAITSFATAPAQLLSQSISDLRACWQIGITDNTGTTINGLSSTTPREVFNSYPAGTGRWEFADGDASTGTQVSSQNFCKALSALYNYEGATGQVTTISDWLRTFTSNSAFATPTVVSTRTLYRSATGTYDPTIAPATLLTVRDSANGYAPIAINGSSYYDWGAFGLLSRIWARRNTASFQLSRLYPLGTVIRFYDGSASDGLSTDRIALRGLSGLSLQTGNAPFQNDAVSAAQFGRTFREARG